MTLILHDLPTRCACISKDEKYLIMGNNDKTLDIWIITENGNAMLKKSIFGNQDRIVSLNISKDDQYLISGGGNGVLKLWNLPDLIKLGFHKVLDQIKVL